MRYVESNLLAGERIVHSAKMHWFIYVPGGVLVVLAIFFSPWGPKVAPSCWVFSCSHSACFC